jgi:hypothetical protein
MASCWKVDQRLLGRVRFGLGSLLFRQLFRGRLALEQTGNRRGQLHHFFPGAAA